MVVHHVQFAVASLSEARKFYAAALAPLGYKELFSKEGEVAGFGVPDTGLPDLWLRPVKGPEEAPMKGLHVAFAAKNREIVDKFHEAALAAGATDNGAPGVRDYVPDYYAAFVIDPQGNNLEVVHL